MIKEKYTMGDRPKPSFTERAESSTTRRETRQTDETSQERFQRVRIENTQNYGIHRENRRANETTEERDRRLDEEIERLRQKLEAAKDTPEQHPAIAFAFQTDYIFREKNAR